MLVELAMLWRENNCDASYCELLCGRGAHGWQDEFVPASGRHVKWYSCGPTVDVAGGVRRIIRAGLRPLAHGPCPHLHRLRHCAPRADGPPPRPPASRAQEYFGYAVEYVMNITDLDDKIILKARKNHLYQQYAAAPPEPAALLADIADARGTHCCHITPLSPCSAAGGED